MTIVDEDTTTVTAGVLDAVRALVPDIAARAEEIEAGRRVPLDLLDQLKAAGCFRVMRPPTHGGTGTDLAGAMTVYEELSRADASTAWITVIGGVGWVDLAGLPRDTFDALLPPDGDTVIAGTFNPTGTAIPSDGGWAVDGRWAFASGCEHADWIYGNCVDTSSGEPALRAVLFRPDEVVIEDTWSVLGMRGTGSHHFAARGVLVPAERTASVFTDPPCVDLPLTRIPVPTAASLLMASVALGVAQGALDDVTALSTSKVPLLSESPLAANPLFQHRLGAADVRLRAARSLLHAEAAAVWAAAEEGEAAVTPALRSRVRSAATHAGATAMEVVDVAYEAGGSDTLYDASPLQRRLRDMRTLGQHFLLKRDTLTTCGALLAGQEPDITVF